MTTFESKDIDTMKNGILNHKWGMSFLFCLALTCCSNDEGVLATYKNASLFESVNGALAVERLNTIAPQEERKSDYFVITHVSDAHLSGYSDGNNIANGRGTNLGQSVAFANREDVCADVLVHTGDMIGNSDKTTRSEAMDILSKFVQILYDNNFIPTFFVNGNHDSNRIGTNPDNFVTPKMIKSLLPEYMTETLKMDDSDNLYFYCDVPGPFGTVFRFIGLDMLDNTENMDYDTQHWAYYSQKQVDWLCNVALKEGMTDRHHVILLNHFAFCPTGDGDETYLFYSFYVHPWNMIPEIIEAYRMRVPLNKTYANSLGGKPIQVNADFATAKGTFVCHLAGHNHAQQQFDIEGLDFHSPSLPKQHMMLCTNMSPSEKDDIYNKVERKPYSLSSNAFNIYMIDVKNRVVYVTYYGAYDTAQPLIDKFAF